MHNKNSDALEHFSSHVSNPSSMLVAKHKSTAIEAITNATNGINPRIVDDTSQEAIPFDAIEVILLDTNLQEIEQNEQQREDQSLENGEIMQQNPLLPPNFSDNVDCQYNNITNITDLTIPSIADETSHQKITFDNVTVILADSNQLDIQPSEEHEEKTQVLENHDSVQRKSFSTHHQYTTWQDGSLYDGTQFQLAPDYSKLSHNFNDQQGRSIHEMDNTLSDENDELPNLPEMPLQNLEAIRTRHHSIRILKNKGVESSQMPAVNQVTGVTQRNVPVGKNSKFLLQFLDEHYISMKESITHSKQGVTDLQVVNLTAGIYNVSREVTREMTDHDDPRRQRFPDINDPYASLGIAVTKNRRRDQLSSSLANNKSTQFASSRTNNIGSKANTYSPNTNEEEAPQSSICCCLRYCK